MSHPSKIAAHYALRYQVYGARHFKALQPTALQKRVRKTKKKGPSRSKKGLIRRFKRQVRESVRDQERTVWKQLL